MRKPRILSPFGEKALATAGLVLALGVLMFGQVIVEAMMGIGP